jgi:hypothetical protein
MKPIAVEGTELYARRGAVRKLVAPLLPNPQNVIVEQLGPGRNTFILGVIPLGRSATSYLNPEEPLVSTRVPKLLMNYYESWKHGGVGGEYHLDRAYMHFHLALRPSPQQLFSLHCDPSLRPTEAHFKYKRGPHVHIEGVSPSLSHAHISLCISDQDLGGTDLSGMMSSFGAAVRMIATELFPCWERSV